MVGDAKSGDGSGTDKVNEQEQRMLSYSCGWLQSTIQNAAPEAGVPVENQRIERQEERAKIKLVTAHGGLEYLQIEEGRGA